MDFPLPDKLQHQLCDDAYLEDIAIDPSNVEEALKYAVAKAGEGNNQQIILSLIGKLQVSDDNFEYTQHIFASLVAHKTMVCAARLLAKRPDLVIYPLDQHAAYSDLIFSEYQKNSHTDEIKAVYFYMLNICFGKEPHFNQTVARALLPLLLQTGSTSIFYCCDLIHTLIHKLVEHKICITPIADPPRSYIDNKEGLDKVILPLMKHTLLTDTAKIDTFLTLLNLAIDTDKNIFAQEMLITTYLNFMTPYIPESTHLTDTQNQQLIDGFYNWIDRKSVDASYPIITILISKFPYLTTQKTNRSSRDKYATGATQTPLEYVQNSYGANVSAQLKSDMLRILQRNPSSTPIKVGPSSSSSSVSSVRPSGWTLGISTDNGNNSNDTQKQYRPTSSTAQQHGGKNKQKKFGKNEKGPILSPLFDEYDDKYESKSASTSSNCLPLSISPSSSSSRSSEGSWTFGLSENPDTTTRAATPHSTASNPSKGNVLINSSITINNNQTPVNGNTPTVTTSKTHTQTSASHYSSHSQSNSTSSSSVKFETTINLAPLAALAGCIVIAGIVIKKWYSAQTPNDAPEDHTPEAETQLV